jgi:hypothetical protein
MNNKLTIHLTAFKQSRVIEVENDEGELEKGVFIPLTWNDLHETRNGTVSCQLAMWERKNNYYYGQTHSIIPMWTGRFRDKMVALGEKAEFIGYAVPFKTGNFKPYADPDKPNFVTVEEDEI